MKKVAIIAISLAALLTGCGTTNKIQLQQLKTHDDYLVECASNGNGVSCDWGHQEQQ